MTPDLQKAQDMLTAAIQQRDGALNAVIMAQAEIAALKREIDAVKKLATTQPNAEAVAQ